MTHPMFDEVNEKLEQAECDLREANLRVEELEGDYGDLNGRYEDTEFYLKNQTKFLNEYAEQDNVKLSDFKKGIKEFYKSDNYECMNVSEDWQNVFESLGEALDKIKPEIIETTTEIEVIPEKLKKLIKKMSEMV